VSPPVFEIAQVSRWSSSWSRITSGSLEPILKGILVSIRNTFSILQFLFLDFSCLRLWIGVSIGEFL
jgi:hypothetical protein